SLSMRSGWGLTQTSTKKWSTPTLLQCSSGGSKSFVLSSQQSCSSGSWPSRPSASAS
ncbi:para, partial [Symbiodinium pilosum]